MSFDLTGAKARLGITDNAQDVEITAALDASLAIAEAYCKRRFKLQGSVETVVHDSAGYVFLDHYPIKTISSIVSENHTDVKYKINKNAGYLDLHGRYNFEEMEVHYEGGYPTLPDDLVVALFAIFDGVWASAQGNSGPTAGAIESVSLTGVGTVRMSTGASASTSGSSAAIPSLALAILSNYKRYLA